MSVFTTKAPKVMNDLMRDFPFSVEDAAAVIGNAGHESGGLKKLQEINPTVAGSRGGYGWFQWTGPRRRAYEAWCKTMNLAPSSDAANYGFLVHELRGPEKHAVKATIDAKGLYNKVIAFEKAFERAGVKHYSGRYDYAQQAMTAYGAASSGKLAQQPDDPAPVPKTVKVPKPEVIAVGLGGLAAWFGDNIGLFIAVAGVGIVLALSWRFRDAIKQKLGFAT